MAAEAIGAVRIDFTANMATFQRSLANADKELAQMQKQMKRLSEAAAKSFDQMTKGAQAFERVGKDLTKNLTLPLAAFAAAAIKAADPAGHFTQKLKDLGVEALVTLQPVGSALISAFEAFEPTLRRAISAVGVLADKFGQLSPETQRMIIVAGAAAAATGPLIVGLSGVYKVGGIATAAILQFCGGLKFLAVRVAPPALAALALLGAALAAFEFGKWFAEESIIGQKAGQAFFYQLYSGVNTIETKWKLTAAAVEGTWKIAMSAALTATAEVIDKTAVGLRLVRLISQQEQAATASLATGMRNAFGGYNGDSLRRELAQIAGDGARQQQIYNIAIIRQFESIQKYADSGKKRSFADLVGDDARAAATQFVASIAPLQDKFGKFIGDVDRYAATSRDRAAAWRLDAEGAKDMTKATEDANKAIERMRDEAMRIRFEIYPDEKLKADIAHIRELAAAFPEILDGPTVQAAIDKLSRGVEKPLRVIRTWRDDFRDMFKDFGRDASRAFAEMATGAKVSFKEILTSWIQMAVEMAAQQWVFGPAFSAIGTSLFGPAPKSAMGNVFSRGEIVPHELGGVVHRQSYFPMRNGVGSMAEGNKPEAIMPLARLNGRLGVHAAGAGSMSVQIFDQRSGGQAVQTSESRGPNGERLLRILIRDEVGQMAGDGGMDRVLGPVYGTRRRPRTR